jgi:hypothetical protein
VFLDRNKINVANLGDRRIFSSVMTNEPVDEVTVQPRGAQIPAVQFHLEILEMERLIMCSTALSTRLASQSDTDN